MRRSTFSFCGIGLLAVGLFLAVPSATLAQSASEEDLCTHISRNSNVEVDLSKMAMKNSENADVKKFAKQVIADDRGITGQVFSYAVGKDFRLTVETPSSVAQAEKQMKPLTGAPFDKMYLVQMDAYVKDDQNVATQASALTKQSDVGVIGTQLQTLSDSRAKDIDKLTQEEGFQIQ